MTKSEKTWHPNFVTYMDFIINHPNYKGLPIVKKPDGSWSWIATANSSIGKARKHWCEEKAKELGFPIEPGVYARVMREIHPTKKKVCQICGREMSLYYHYLSANCIKAIKRKFGIEYTEIDHISVVWDDLLDNGYTQCQIAEFFIKYAGLQIPVTSSKDKVINTLESVCRINGKTILSPGAMSNFPDRFDGFHTYNRCCRSTQDKGRSKENLKSYNKDRRAYEYWSDGNIHAANQFMGSKFFEGTTADHVGPISLGFVHDPRYLQPMSGNDNSTKRDRLQVWDIEKILAIQARTHIYPMSWYSKMIWEYIKDNYEAHPEKVPTVYREALKQNMSNFMFVLWIILRECGHIGEDFLVKNLLKPKYKYFEKSYAFNEKGEIIKEIQRHFTERNAHEFDRYIRIAIESVYEFNQKENRNIKNDLTQNEYALLLELCIFMNAGKCDLESLNTLMFCIQKRIIDNL